MSHGDVPADWAVLRTAPNQLTAEMWRELLMSEGIPAAIAAADAMSFLGLASTPCRVLVPTVMLDSAEQVLAGEAWVQARDEPA